MRFLATAGIALLVGGGVYFYTELVFDYLGLTPSSQEEEVTVRKIDNGDGYSVVRLTNSRGKFTICLVDEAQWEKTSGFRQDPLFFFETGNIFSDQITGHRDWQGKHNPMQCIQDPRGE